ncbi:MAG TPA: glycosyl hydrolase family 18 protein [Cytophagales bacterium]
MTTSRTTLRQWEADHYAREGQKSEADWGQQWKVAQKSPYKTDTLPAKLIYGFHPYWMGDSYGAYNFKMLSRVAYYAYPVDPHTGRYGSALLWNPKNLVASAHRQGSKVDLCLTNYSRYANAVFLSRPAAQRRLMESVLVLLAEQHADGVNLDFQEIPAHRRTHFTRFVQQFAALLARSDPDYRLSITLPPVDWEEAFDLNALAPSVAYFIVSGYDYYGPDSPYAGDSLAPGPGSLLYSRRGFNVPSIDYSVKQYLQRGVKPDQLILCLPYAGYLWDRKSRKFAPQPYLKLQENWFDPVDTTVWATPIYKAENGEVATGWFDNAASLAAKYDYINQSGLAGVGIWGLGYDRGSNKLWALLAQKFLPGRKKGNPNPNPDPTPDPKPVPVKLPVPLSSPTDFTLLSQAVVPEAAAPEEAAYVLRKLPVADHTPRVLAWIAFGAVLLGAAALVGFVVSLANSGVRATVLGRRKYQVLLVVLVLLLTGLALHLREIAVAPVYLAGAGLLLGIALTAVAWLSRKPNRPGRLP